MAAQPPPESPQQRAAEQAIIAGFLGWLASVQARITLDDVVEALTHGSWVTLERALRAAGAWSLDLLPFARHAAEKAAQELSDDLRLTVPMTFDIHDPNFELAVEQAGAQAVSEVTEETRRAIREIVTDAYAHGLHPYEFAPQIREVVGLTTRMSKAVLRFYESQMRAGVAPRVALKRSLAYAERLRTQRARMIARTETLTALSLSRIQGYEQAAAKGLLIGTEPMLQWLAHVDDRTCPRCLALNGEEIPLGSDFPEGSPPLHPACRCVLVLRLGARPPSGVSLAPIYLVP